MGMGITVESASDRVLQGAPERVHQPGGASRSRGGPAPSDPLRLDIPARRAGETGETVRETLRFAETRIGPRDVAFFNIGIRVYPGTELETIARDRGRYRSLGIKCSPRCSMCLPMSMPDG